jgi:short-subunit dehydrogenase
MAGNVPFLGMAAYNASKYAALGLTVTVRRELDNTGVTISAVPPSAIRTSLSSGVRLGGLLSTVNPQTKQPQSYTRQTCEPERPVPHWLTT